MWSAGMTFRVVYLSRRIPGRAPAETVRVSQGGSRRQSLWEHGEEVTHKFVGGLGRRGIEAGRG